MSKTIRVGDYEVDSQGVSYYGDRWVTPKEVELIAAAMEARAKVKLPDYPKKVGHGAEVRVHTDGQHMDIGCQQVSLKTVLAVRKALRSFNGKKS